MAVAYTVPTIAITGSPKDYTGIEAARKRQEAADEAKVQSEGRKKDAELRKALFMKPGEMLPGRTTQVLDLISETIKEMDAAKDEADFYKMNDAQAKAVAQLNAFKDEKKAFDAAKKDYDAGNVVVGREFSKAYEAKDAESLKALGNSAIFNEQTGTYVPVKAERVDLITRQRQLASNFQPEPTGKKKYDFAGQPYEELAVPIERVRQANYIDFDTDPLIRTNAVHNYIASNPQDQGLSNDEIIQKARIKYGESGVALALSDQTRKGGRGGLTINIGQNAGGGLGSDQATPYGEFPPTSKIVYTSLTDPSKEGVTSETKNYFGFSAGNFKVAGAPPGEAVYNDSGKKVDDSEVRNTTFNQFLGRLVLTKDFKAPNGEVYPKGFSVPIEYTDLAIDNGYAKAAVVATGISDNGESLSFNAIGLTPSLYAAQSEAEKKQLNLQIQDAKKQADQLQAKVNKQYLAARAEREKKGKGNDAPKPAEKPKPTSASVEEKKKKAEKIASESGIKPLR